MTKAQETKTANAAKQVKTTAANVIAATKYIERMRDHMATAHTPSKAVKNAYATALLGANTFGTRYAKAVAAVFNIKDGESMKAAVQNLCDRYKGRTPRKGFSEYYVHQYFEKLITKNATTCAACWNYLATKRAEEQNAKTASK